MNVTNNQLTEAIRIFDEQGRIACCRHLINALGYSMLEAKDMADIIEFSTLLTAYSSALE